MIKNYFKSAFRNLWKHKTFSFINILGLTVGLTCFLLIALYIFDELTFDRFHKNSENIYRVIEDRTTAEGKESKIASVAYQISERAKTDFPEIKKMVRLITLGRANITTPENTNAFYEPFRIANPEFLTTFDFRLLAGDKTTALREPHSVVMTEEAAEKIFGKKEVLGKLIKTEDSVPFRVTGILKNLPSNSHLSFGLLFSESSMTREGYKKFINSDWSSNVFSTYFLVDSKADIHQLEAKIDKLVAENKDASNKSKSRFILQPLKKIHFYSKGFEGDEAKTGNLSYVYVFSIVALFVLLIACINYMNLTTARFTNRAKEIGVRKVAGASRKNLLTQFLAEAFLMTIVALIFALALAGLLLPYFNSFTDKQLSLGPGTDYRIWAGVAATIILVGLLSGTYPAFFQSGLKPFQLFKGKFNIGKGNLSLRRSLVVFQFSLSIIMIVATIIVYQQMKYLNTKDMGFNKDQLVVIDINSRKVRLGAETIKSGFLKLSQVQNVSASSRVPGEWKDLPRIKVKNERISSRDGNDMYFIGIDDNFLKTYDIRLFKGRNFYNNLADTSSVIINESAAKELGITEALGQRVEIPYVDYNGDGAPLPKPYIVSVVGIVKDFNFKSLRLPMAPMVLGYQENPIQSIDYFTAKVAPDHIDETLKQMDGIIHSVDQNHLLEYHFLDKQWDRFYRQDKIRETIFLIVATLTIFIACLGLFGLATFAAEQRIKEIGIRKVLGASVGGIISMLSKDFLKLVAIAAIIAFPVAWWMMNSWLADFAYRTKIYWWVFILAGLIALFIAWATVGLKALKAAIANPVKSLRTE